MPKGLSLHIGVNSVDPAHYQGWSGPLNACEADAAAMHQIAVGQGFSAKSVLTAAATRAAVTGFLAKAAGELADGDMLLLTYSGHGGQVPDLTGEEEDGQDETWCLFDGQLIDDEIYQALSRLSAGVRVLVLSDSCHSGTVVKLREYALLHGMGRDVLQRNDVAYKAMPPEVALRTYAANRKLYDGIAATLPKSRDIERGDMIKGSVRLMSGCQDNQLSLDGTFNGAFTAALLVVWAAGQFHGDYHRFHKEILARMPLSQSPNHLVLGRANPAYDRQKPFTL